MDTGRSRLESSGAELVRWAGSVGIFYLLLPVYLVSSEDLLGWLIPFGTPVILTRWSAPVFACAGVIGLYFIVSSIRDQITRGRGHPFDLTGGERFSRPTQVLLTDGVYRWTRNPMGFGDTLLYAAITGLTDSAWSLLIQVPAYAVVVVWNHLFNERPALVNRFGERYRDYEKSTPCFIPRPWRTRRPR